MKVSKQRRSRGKTWSRSLNFLFLIGLSEIVSFHVYHWVVYELSLVTVSEPSNINPKNSSSHKESQWNGSPKEAFLGGASEPLIFDSLAIPIYGKSNRTDQGGINVTIDRLIRMGFSLETIQNESDLPAWSQIIDNYGEDPVILGLERCAAFRREVVPTSRFVAPAGLFSTGTNLVNNLLFANCHPPENQRKQKFHVWQVPWGKHNPASARLRFKAPRHEFRNQSHVLPIVMVRHPFTWMLALCKHHYSLIWNHDLDACEDTLGLENRVMAQLGFARDIEYASLIHVWRDWNLEYFRNHQYPLLIVRHEDLVYRPEPVIEQICSCVGGRMTTEPFQYQLDSANRGRGHGEARSDLISAWIKYGKPLRVYQNRFTSQDWKIIREVLANDFGMLKALNYFL